MRSKHCAGRIVPVKVLAVTKQYVGKSKVGAFSTVRSHTNSKYLPIHLSRNEHIPTFTLTYLSYSYYVETKRRHTAI